jgi:quercetin dioxygenase-like cupin family protein
METKLFPQREMIFTKHPVFDDVRIAIFITGEKTTMASVCLIEIVQGSETPIHIHEEEADSIFVVRGKGEAYVNGQWKTIEPGDYIYVPAQREHAIRNSGAEPLRLFIHHTQPLT